MYLLLIQYCKSFSGLQKFINTADGYGDGSVPHDIVAGYCKSSDTCAELFKLLDSSDGQTTKFTEVGY